jgi:tetratricopeptide (TPR) repeat protein
MGNLAFVYIEQGKYAQAETLQHLTLETQRHVLGPEHPDTLISATLLGEVYCEQGKYAQAGALFTQNLEIQRRVLGPGHPYTLTTLADIASLYRRERKFALAETNATQVLATSRKALGNEHWFTMVAMSDLALVYQLQEKFAQSEPLAREAVETYRKQQPDDWQRYRAESLLGASLAGQKKYAEAEPLLLAGYQGMTARKDKIAVPDRYHLDRAHEWLVQLYTAWGKPDKAAEWRRK